MPIANLDDLDIHYRIHGEGPPVLGIMGFSLDQRFWASQVPAVTKTHRFITFDNRGTGRSSKGTASSVDEMANDALRLLDHLEIDKTVVFGLSMGGAIAQRFVLDNPDRVSALILGVTFSRPIEFMRRQHEIARLVINAAGPRGLLEASLVRMFTPRFFEMGRETIDRMIAAFFSENGPEAASSEVLLAQLDALEKHDAIAELPKIAVPTLVLGGKNDMMVPGFASEEIAAAVPGAELHMFETGHGCMIEELEGFNGAISTFLERIR